ncbi:MAG TPA: hypothetical protein VLN08_07530 [Vicinamibacterales bacterium]|nr:hypothetical protein [Vicinamibacterales bacterium]
MWTHQHRPFACVVGLLAVIWIASAASAAAQDAQAPPAVGARVRPEARQAQGRAAAAPQGDRLDIAELQRLFDAYTVMQAQEALQLDDEQFGQFLPKLKALQDTRRRGEQARNRLVADLGRLTAASAAVDESTVRARLRDLQELESRTSADLRRAYDTLDAQLDVRRQARFRVFEQNMERRKLQLMLRARRGAPGGAR